MQIHATKTQVSPLTAGLTGLVLGVIGAAAIALSDELTRKRVTKKATDVKNDLHKWSTEKLHDLQERGEVLKMTERQKLEKDTQAKIEDKLDDKK